MAQKLKRSIFLFRRDLRLVDNTGLLLACQKSESVLPAFCYDSRQVDPSKNPYFGSNSFQFMVESLHELDEELQAIGGKLYKFAGLSHEVVRKLIRETRAQALFVNSDYTPFAVERDRLIAEVCRAEKVQFIESEDHLLVPLKEVPKGTREYKVFTPFYNKFKQFPVRKPDFTALSNFMTAKFDFTCETPPYEHNEQLYYRGGRAKGLKLLQNLPRKYKDTRDLLYLKDGTSGLSAYLKFGCISVREMFYETHKQLKDEEALARQLYWREFYVHVLLQNGYQVFNKKYEDLKWENDEGLFKCWQEGRTGTPIVDAAMRMLKRTGHMHNRLRMVVSSYLTKDLLIDWRWGEKHFANYLVDYDPAQNNGGWQWAASTGCDPQPYFRIFNPALQSQRFDPDCKFIKQQLPELEKVPPKDIHFWEEAHSKHKGVYHKPIVIHGVQKEKALSLFKGQAALEQAGSSRAKTATRQR